jgi:hypothetical protein
MVMSTFNGAVIGVKKGGGRKCGQAKRGEGGGATQLKRGSTVGSTPWCGRWAAGGMARRWAKGGAALDRHGEEERAREGQGPGGPAGLLGRLEGNGPDG